MGTPRFSALLLEENNFFDSLFAAQDDRIPKVDLLLTHLHSERPELHTISE